jgi:hypothetical protein
VSTLPKKELLTIGITDSSIIGLKEFLSSSGFMDSTSDANNTFDEATRDALIEFQKSRSIPPTGLIDRPTLDELWVPTCEYSSRSLAEAKGIGFRWKRQNIPLTWTIREPDPKVPFTSDALKFGFAQWKKSTPFPMDFAMSTGTGLADINIYFDAIPNRRPSEVAATFPPKVGEQPAVMKVICQRDVNWTSDPNKPQFEATDLYAVITHEIGHCLGLDHSADPNALMFAKVRNGERDIKPDDILGITNLYKD